MSIAARISSGPARFTTPPSVPGRVVLSMYWMSISDVCSSISRGAGWLTAAESGRAESFGAAAAARATPAVAACFSIVDWATERREPTGRNFRADRGLRQVPKKPKLQA